MKIYLTILTILMLSFCAFGQSNSLDEITEVVTVDGSPTIKVLSPKKGGYTQIKLQKREGEDTFIFDVVKQSKKNPVGKLFVTKNKVYFEPLEDNQTKFDLNKTEIKEVIIKTSSDKFPYLQIKFDQDEAKIAVKFDRYQYLIDRRSLTASENFLLKAINDFDSAVVEFNRLISSK